MKDRNNRKLKEVQTDERERRKERRGNAFNIFCCIKDKQPIIKETDDAAASLHHFLWRNKWGKLNLHERYKE